MTSRFVSKFVGGLALGLFSIAIASPVLAAPALFAGTLKRFGPNPYPTTSVGPTSGAPGALSVMGSAPASFTLPASTLGITFTTITSFPGYPAFTGFIHRPVLAGSFKPGGGPAATVTNPANTTAVPNLSLSPRAGFLRLIPGTLMFGGTARHLHDDYYKGTRIGSVGYYQFNITVLNSAPGGPTGITQFGTTGTRVHTSLTSGGFPLSGHSPAARTGAPWITGMVTAYAPAGYYVTTRSDTGVDARSPAGLNGSISLVTPTLLHAFVSNGGGTILAQAGGFAYQTKMELSFLPEPGQFAMLGVGVATLLGLYRLRRR